ncbi:MAG TPA: zeta toxin family protein [Solirubrobacteraceae bacterium]|nr:zeta toxin family protein [Solirubrobacteraceae bacterium]
MRRYEREWWLTDRHVEERIRASPGLLEDLEKRVRAGDFVQTKDVYWARPDGWTPERIGTQAVALEGAVPPPTTPPTNRPIAAFLLGLPGSGKSSVLKRIVENVLSSRGDGAYQTRDADDIRVRLPEYSGGLGSHVVQEEVVDVTYESAPALLTLTHHVIIDVVGDPVWLPREIEFFASHGYEIVVLCTELPVDVAIRRAKLRALESGRHVSVAYLESCAGRPRVALAAARRGRIPLLLWAVVDTSAPDRLPRIIEGDPSLGAPGDVVAHW